MPNVLSITASNGCRKAACLYKRAVSVAFNNLPKGLTRIACQFWSLKFVIWVSPSSWTTLLTAASAFRILLCNSCNRVTHAFQYYYHAVLLLLLLLFLMPLQHTIVTIVMHCCYAIQHYHAEISSICSTFRPVTGHDENAHFGQHLCAYNQCMSSTGARSIACKLLTRHTFTLCVIQLENGLPFISIYSMHIAASCFPALSKETDVGNGVTFQPQQGR